MSKSNSKLMRLFKKKQNIMRDYCIIEAYNDTGFAITVPAKDFIDAVRYLIKTAKNMMESGLQPDQIGVKMTLKEELAENEKYGEVFDTAENYDTPLFKALGNNGDVTIEVLYSLRAFNGKVLDFTNNIIRMINLCENKKEILNKPVRICVPDINDSFIEFNWSYR